MKKRILAACICASLAVPAAWPQGKGLSVKTLVDWKRGTVGIEVTRDLDRSIPALPRAEADAEAAIDAAFPGLFPSAVSPLVVDSSRTIGSVVNEDPGFFEWMLTLARGARKSELSLSPDFSKVTAAYSFPLFGERGIAARLFPTQDRPIPRRLGYVPTRVFSGLVIYAKDKVPAVGLDQEQTAVPALFPRIFDEEMNLVLDKWMCSPEALAKWGMVGYADGIDQHEIELRTGLHPLKTVARAVFGTQRTDLVIPTEAVKQILSIQENRELLKECRILVVYESLK